MWSTTGARTLEKLVFKGTHLLTGAGLTDEQAETLINAAAHEGEDWHASRGLIDPDLALDRYQEVLDRLDDQFAEYAADMEMENQDRVDHLIHSLCDKISVQIAQNDAVIARLEFEGKTRTIPARRGKIKKLEEFRDIQKALFEKKRAISTEQRNVITVAIHVGSSG
jgi:hypothetical protein